MTLTWLSSPRVMSMKKKSADQKGEAGRLATAVGYTTKARPAPGGGMGDINIHVHLSYSIVPNHGQYVRSSPCFARYLYMQTLN